MSDIYFFFNDTATTEIYTLSLHDALPICLRYTAGMIWSVSTLLRRSGTPTPVWVVNASMCQASCRWATGARSRSEEHTSELQSRQYLVCRLLLEKKKTLHHPIVSTTRSFI